MRQSRFITRILWYCAAAVCWAIAATRPTTAVAESSPYEARVVATGASVHSGPGEKFYPTDTLAQGDVVEVYREKPGGWLAIRPPVNSFSWVAGSDLKQRDGGLAEVIKDDTASRIGSRLSEKHNAAQVRLKKGEVVEVLDEESINGETWCKIAPPAGEFRWIQASLIERIGPVRMASAEVMEPVKATSGANANAAAPPLIASPPATDSQPVAPPASPMPGSSVAAAASPTTAAVKLPAAGPVADDLSRELATIELRLSRMVAAPVNLWNTSRLERDTAQLLARAQTAAERDAVQVTLNKINRFAAIGHQSSQVPPAVAAATGGAAAAGAMAANSQPPVTPLPGTAPSPATPPAAAAAGSGPYDAVGILRPVVSKRPGAPQFALVDDRGQVLSFVTPSPDVNLQPYLGRRVGVTGSRGYIAEFNRTHVTAARVAPLGDRLVR